MQTIIDRREEICAHGSVCLHVMANFTKQQFFTDNETGVLNPNNQTYLYEYKACKSTEECIRWCQHPKEINKTFISCSRYCCFGDNCNDDRNANNGKWSIKVPKRRCLLQFPQNYLNIAGWPSSFNLRVQPRFDSLSAHLFPRRCKRKVSFFLNLLRSCSPLFRKH